MFKSISTGLPAAVGYLAIVITMGDKLMIHPVNAAHVASDAMIANQRDNEHIPFHAPRQTEHKPHHPEVPEEPLSSPPHIDPEKEKRITLKKDLKGQKDGDRHSLAMPPEPHLFKFTFREAPTNWQMWRFRS